MEAHLKRCFVTGGVIQSTPNNSNLQGKQKKVRLGVRVIAGKIIIIETVPKGNENCFELARGSSYTGFELPGVDCIRFYEANPLNCTWGEGCSFTDTFKSVIMAGLFVVDKAC